MNRKPLWLFLPTEREVHTFLFSFRYDNNLVTDTKITTAKIKMKQNKILYTYLKIIIRSRGRITVENLIKQLI